jgi:two-component system, cell cycle response regulator CpdR
VREQATRQRIIRFWKNAIEQRIEQGMARILLAEDDTSMREYLQRALQRVGYEVEAVGCGTEAVPLLESMHFDLLLTDIVMPGGSGRELAEELTAAHAGLAVLFMSGYTPDVVLRQGVVQENVAFLAKPFTAPALAEALRHTLASRSERGRLSEAKGT